MRSPGSWTAREVLPLMLTHCSSVSPFVLTIWVPHKYVLFGFVFLSEISSQRGFSPPHPPPLHFPPGLTCSTNDKAAPRKATCVCRLTEAVPSSRQSPPSTCHAEDHGSLSTHQSQQGAAWPPQTGRQIEAGAPGLLFT